MWELQKDQTYEGRGENDNNEYGERIKRLETWRKQHGHRITAISQLYSKVTDRLREKNTSSNYKPFDFLAR